jgi:cytochrome c556
MRRSIAALSILALATGGALAALADPIAERQAAMKRISGHMRDLAPFARGEQAYDAAAVMQRLQALDAEMKAYDVALLFPDGSETGGDTEASAKIWDDKAGFQAAVDKFAGDIAAAVSANPQDLNAFTPVFGEVGANCRSCHGAFRE